MTISNTPYFRRRLLVTLVGSVLAMSLVLVAGPAPGKSFTVNPVSRWEPIVTRMELDPTRIAGGNPGPPFVKVQGRFPDIPSAWEALKPLVKIRLPGQLWTKDEPVISGWRTTKGPGIVGIEAKRSDRIPEDRKDRLLPILSFDRGMPVPVNLEVEIWSTYRILEQPDLVPTDPEYQKLIADKIEVHDFSLSVHELMGASRATTAAFLHKAANAEPRVNGRIGEFEGIRSLSHYLGKEYRVPATAGYLGELQFRMTLRFPELEAQMDTVYDTKLEAQIRFISLDHKYRVISRKLKKVE